MKDLETRTELAMNGHCHSNGDVNSKDLDGVMRESDVLYEDSKFQETYDMLAAHKHIENEELLWRLARVCCVCAKLEGENGHAHRKRDKMEEGFGYVDRALKLNDTNPRCHSWYATMLHYTSEAHGLKQSYLSAFAIKDHYTKAVELDPKDAISLHSLGYWCYEFAHLGWMQKKILAICLRTPPQTTYEQALEFFHKAEEAQPGFFSMNLVMAGKAHHCLKQYDKARALFTRALLVIPRTPDEREAHSRATDMLKKMDHHHH